ncbi:hypothetical protein BCON_0010g00350 [Botryotinia convoluta]|uniref:Uncharacterized protein n=1 Tax=Botryotinia convoluta TaxID=54673 RepID=A0A4Z1IX15_9HELO|nr:hypothetical protein BCON_0010g00350 [Botryotinia convoluta]
MDIAEFDRPIVVLNVSKRSDPNPLIQLITLTSYCGRHDSYIEERTTNGSSIPLGFRIRHAFELNLSRFDAYNWGQARPGDYRLTRRSYLHLMKRLGSHANTFHPTSRINNRLLQAPSPVPPPPTQQLQTVNRRRENNLYASLEPEECCP